MLRQRIPLATTALMMDQVGVTRTIYHQKVGLNRSNEWSLDMSMKNKWKYLFAERCKGTGSTNHCEEPYFPYRISIGYGDRAPRICWNKKDIPLHTTKPSAVTVVEVAVSDGIVINEKSFAANSKLTEETKKFQLREIYLPPQHLYNRLFFADSHADQVVVMRGLSAACFVRFEHPLIIR